MEREGWDGGLGRGAGNGGGWERGYRRMEINQKFNYGIWGDMAKGRRRIWWVR